MPLFHFNIIDHAEKHYGEAYELPHVDAARAMALRTSGEIISDLDVKTLGQSNGWVLLLTDEAGRQILELRFSATAAAA